MRSHGLAFLLIAFAGLLGCGRLHDQPLPTKWTTGFWFWNGSSASAFTETAELDVIFCHVATIRRGTMLMAREPWRVYGDLPEQLPPAREYWLVFRLEGQGIPALEAIPALERVVSELQAKGRRRGLQIAGIQLDVDSPTRALPQYATFLRAVRKSLPPNMQISITGLLDWFRTGTRVGEVLKEVDEFVPQFYDVQDTDRYTGGTSIASRFKAAQWSPIFNRYRKRFRIGISTFGRSRLLRRGRPLHPGSNSVVMVGDIMPLDIAVDSAFHLQTSRTDAKELVLSYRATRKTQIGYTDFEPGDEFQFIVPTLDGIGEAVDEAKRMHEYCAGVVFFRWPAFSETLAAQPEEVLRAAGVITSPSRNHDELRVVDGGCAAVNCSDLYLIIANPFSPNLARYRIHSSAELEYFLPSEKMPVQMSGPSQIELSLPPYCGRSRMYLGRAVTAKRAHFTVE